MLQFGVLNLDFLDSLSFLIFSYVDVAIHRILHDLVPLFRLEQSCLQCNLRRPHQPDPPDDFHLLRHKLGAEVGQFVPIRPCPATAFEIGRVEYALEAVTNAEPETYWLSVPSLCAPPPLEHRLFLLLFVCRLRLHHTLS